jgi:predicted enzyme related to lactoylglutathione lyase
MQITEIRHGMPCWFELATTDPDSSSAFYQGLFGWQRFDLDLGPEGTYSYFSNENGCVGAMSCLMAEQRSLEFHSNWRVFFAVDDCDGSTAKALELGAKVILPPMDVNECSRMSVISDPSGAVCSLWHSEGGGGGPYVMFEDYAIGWVELATPDSPAAREIYTALLGWDYVQTSVSIAGDSEYHELAVGDHRYGGIMPMNAEWFRSLPSHWGIYIRVPDVDAYVRKACKLGGSNPVPAYDIEGIGRMAMIADPIGARFYVVKLER